MLIYVLIDHYNLIVREWSKGSSVSIVTRPRAGRFPVQYPTGIIGFPLLRNVHSASGASPALFLMSTLFLYRESSGQGADVKNEWNSTSTVLVRLHGMDRGNFTVFNFLRTVE
jgi:hypothetical protein